MLIDGNWEIAAGATAFVASLAYLAWKARSLYFGLTVLCLFMVSSASLAGYMHSVIFRQPLKWMTPAHVDVIKYSIIGCLAMLAGVMLAWRPKTNGVRPGSNNARSSFLSTPWINLTFGWFVFAVGCGATLASSALHRVATVGTAVYALANFSTFGLLVLLAIGLREKRYGPFCLALVVYIPVMLLQALASGHTPVKLSLVIPAICLIAGSSRVSLKSIAILMFCGVVLVAAMAGWLKSRNMLRTGQLVGLSAAEKAARFLPEWYAASINSLFDVRIANEAIRSRIDMTDILAMQMRFQPRHEPFAHGQTAFDSLYTLIPRAFWPRKPVVAGGAAFVSRFTGMVRDPRDTTSLGVPYQFELYANGGAVCVVVGLFVIGYFCGYMERRLFEVNSSLASLLARISITMTLCDGGQRTDVVLPSIVAGGLTYFALGKVIQSVKPDFASQMMGRSRGRPKEAADQKKSSAPHVSRPQLP